MMKSAESRKRPFVRLAFLLPLMLILSFLCEVFLFNFRYFLPVLNHAPEISFSAGSLKLRGGCQTEGNAVLVTGKSAEIDLPGPNAPLYNIKLNVSGGKKIFYVQIKYEDQNFTSYDLNAGDWPVSPRVEATQYCSVVSSGNCRSLRLLFTKVPSGGITLNSVELNRPFFQFNLLRFFLLFFVLACFVLIGVFRLWALPGNKYPGLRAKLFSAMALLCLLFALGTYVICTGRGAVHRVFPSATRDNYLLLTRAFDHGHLDLMIKPPKALEQLKDPYNYSLRKKARIPYKFDTAYYKGKYYCYFGVAPVLTLLLPFKLITGYYLTTKFACLLFMLAALAALALLYWQLAGLWFPEINLLAFLSGELFLLLGSNLLWLIAIPKYYELAVLSCLTFLFLALNMVLLAFRFRSRSGLFLFFSGLCFALMVASRPTSLFYLVLALPFLAVVLRERQGYGAKAAALVSFFAPLGAAACGIMAYNDLRFGSVTEFGARYQLTVSNIRYSRLSDFSLIFYGVFQYLFQPVSVKMQFPFFHAVTLKSQQVTEYYFNRPTAGVFSFPAMLSLLPCAALLRRMKPRPAKKFFLCTAMAASLAVLYLDTMLGGVCMRYTLDFSPILAICAALFWLEAAGLFGRIHAGSAVTKLFAAAAAVTVLISVDVCLFRTGSVLKYHPNLFAYLYDTFTFWN